MTTNQISYAKLVEETRHNKAMEQETERHAREDERIRSESNDITRSYNTGLLYNQERSNAINLQHYSTMDAETERNNKEKNALQRDKQNKDFILGIGNLEVARGNLSVNEGNLEVNRGNLEVSRENAQTNRMNAETNAKNAQTRIKELRQQKVRDKNTYTAAMRNADNDAERNRLTAQYNNARIIVDQLILDETKRHNAAQEEISIYDAETRRYDSMNKPGPATQVSNMESSTYRNYATAGKDISTANYTDTQNEWYGQKTQSEIAANYGKAVDGVSFTGPYNGKEPIAPNLNTPYGYGYYSPKTTYIMPITGTGSIPMITGGP